jgi:Cu2+-exporting ATPase
MLLEVGILFIAYIGSRAYESYNQIKSAKSQDSLTLPPPPLISKDTIVNCSEAEQQDYFAISTISLGLAILRQINASLTPVSLGLFIYTFIPFMKYVETKFIREKRVDSYTLSVVATIILLAMGRYFTTAFGVWFLHGGTLIVAKTKGYSQKIFQNIVEQSSRQVWVLRNQVEIEVPLADIKVNDILVLNAGEVIPVDGIITAGMATVDQHVLTGESRPLEKSVGEPVLASTLVIAGRIQVKVEKSGQETKIAQIGHQLSHALSFQSDLQLKGEQWSNKAIVPMLGIAGAMLPTFGAEAAVVFMSSHIGDRIRILAPLGTLNYITSAYHQGVVIKDGRALEELQRVDTILLDKTGTLTHEQPEVGKIIVGGGYTAEEILAYAAAAEHQFTHPVAKAILTKAQDAHIHWLNQVDNVDYQIGYGITAKLENRLVQLGSARFMAKAGLRIPNNIVEEQQRIHKDGSSLVLVAIDHQVSGAIEIRSQVRTEVKPILQALRQRGIKSIAIVSGDQKQPTQILAAELGIDDYFYDVLPEHKAQIVKQLQQEGRTVCFIGDGINDAIAMNQANVSVSLRGAAAVATDVAQVILMNGNLSQLTTLFDLANDLNHDLHHTLIITLIPSIVNLSGAFLFHFNPLTSLLINFGFTSLGLGYVMLPLICHQERE